MRMSVSPEEERRKLKTLGVFVPEEVKEDKTPPLIKKDKVVVKKGRGK